MIKSWMRMGKWEIRNPLTNLQGKKISKRDLSMWNFQVWIITMKTMTVKIMMAMIKCWMPMGKWEIRNPLTNLEGKKISKRDLSMWNFQVWIITMKTTTVKIMMAMIKSWIRMGKWEIRNPLTNLEGKKISKRDLSMWNFQVWIITMKTMTVKVW